jgi:hypothetical protein
MTNRRHPGGWFSARFDRPCDALIDRDRWKLTSVRDRKSAEVIHNCLPFLDFLHRAFVRH